MDNVVRIHLLYDHERASPNRAAGHIHFRIHARAGAKLTLEFLNLDNVWNGQPGSVAGELKTVAISEDGRTWKTVPTQSLPGNRVQLHVDMRTPQLYVARMEPYRLSDLDRFLGSIRGNRLVQITPIGRTVAGRDLEIVRIGSPDAPYHVFVRARAHPWESGSNWVAQGLIQRLLKDDDESRRFLRVYSVSVLPMANKDGVARGGPDSTCAARISIATGTSRRIPTRTGERRARAMAGSRDRRRPAASPGAGAAQRRRRPAPHQPPTGSAARSSSRPHGDLRGAAAQADLVHRRATNAAFRNSGTLGDGWLERYGIDAAVHEFNCNWVEGLKDYTSSRHWMDYGAGLPGSSTTTSRA